MTRTEEERVYLLGLTKKGKVAARQLTRAPSLLQADAGVADTAMARALPLGIATVERLRTRVVEEGLDGALSERPRPRGQRKLAGQQKALLVARACRPPPEGRPCWTMPVLADSLVAIHVVAAISDETVRRPLKTTCSTQG